jgi:hypothetical protein
MQYNLRKLQREIRALIKKHYDAGTPELIKRDIQKLLPKYKGLSATQAERLRKQTETKLKAEYVKEKTPDAKPMIDKMLNTDYAIVQNKVNTNIVNAVQRGIRSGMTIKEMTNLIDRKVEIGKHHANTVARTARIAQNRAAKIEKGNSAGAEKYKLKGPSPERDFCRKYYGEVKTLKEWARLDNGQGLPVVPYCGGYNCKHWLEPVFD